MALLSGPQVTTSSTTAPDYLRPYLDRALAGAETAFTEPYKPYTGQLTAGLAPVEQQGINAASNLRIPGQFQSAGNLYNAAASGIMGLAGFQPGSLTGGYNPADFTSSYTAQQTTGGVFDGGAAQQYMSPYQQNVTDIAKREAERDFQKQQSQLRARAGAAGAFGGSRATLLETENQRNQNQLLDDIQTKGLQSAFTNAQDMFERDRQARLSASQQNEATRQAQANLGLDAQRLGDQSRQFADTSQINRFNTQEQARQNAAQLGMRGYESAANIAQGLGSLGAQIGSEARANIGTQLAAGSQQREQQQLNLNNQYKQFLEERGYPSDQAAKFANVLAALGSNQRVTTNVGPEVGSLQQILGLLSTGTGILGELGGSGGAAAGLGSLLGGIGSLFGDSGEGAYDGEGAFDFGDFLGDVGSGFSDAVGGFTDFLGGLFD